VIPVVDLSWQHAPLRADLDAAIARVLDREWYILGEEVHAFETAFAAYCRVRHCVAVANGTEALLLALRALGIGPGDGVLTVANAGGYATSAITQAGAVPVYVDVDPTTLLMSAETLASLLASNVRAVIVTHLYGRMADVDAIAGIARPRGVALIEDCAQAHGARRDGRMAGTLSDIGCYSFYPTKNLGALGDAGALIAEDAALAQRLRQLRAYGWSSKYHCTIAGGMNSRMDELQAAVLSVKLPHLDTWNQRRRAIARRYTGAIRNPHIVLPPPADDADVVHQYVVRSPARDALRAYLAGVGVATEIHYPVADHLQDAWRALAPATELRQTVHACASVLSLPCHPGLDDAEIDAVAAACNQWRGS
jgi:dTDP-3-amino-2,3,6-trideoxy-4-keto-D-glucose/dTDP-3-amino-3,4,6-trideoxy-alpha-D-glucose/dTDP-2,6-dideoxy-D-kanosamine transaminase